MIDFHSHILPGIDDGSRDVAESLQMISMLREQGVDTVVATPHFYANHHSVQRFCARRQAAYERLIEAIGITQASAQIVLGAEVRYYEGISRLEGLTDLCIGGTRLLLLEMPMARWTEYTVRELVDLSCDGRIRLVLAHIERYYTLQSREVWQRLLDCGILMQTNAEFFTDWRTRGKAVRMLGDHRLHLLGSDCHNLTDRAPQILQAADRIRKKLGEEFLSEMNRFAAELLKNN